MKIGLFAKLVLVPLTLLLSFSTAVSAEESNVLNNLENSTSKMKVSSGITIEKYSDGRVKGFESVKNLNELQKTDILKEMKFTTEEIEKFPSTIVDQIISEGGVKVQLDQKNLKHIYTSLDGTDYIVNEETKDIVAKIKEADMEKLKGSSSVGTLAMGDHSEGIFYGYGNLIYHGKVNNNLEYKYSYVTNFDWSQPPFFAVKDKVVVAYETNATRTGATGYNYTNHGNNDGMSLDYSVYGVEGSINPIDSDYGYLKVDVNIPVSNQGYAGLFVSGYAHAWTPVPLSVSIGPASIDLSGVGDKWTWDNYFTIGNSF